ncbi:MAG: multiheme c-type cytochrome [Candidatus Acidiferrales bacterium]
MIWIVSGSEGSHIRELAAFAPAPPETALASTLKIECKTGVNRLRIAPGFFFLIALAVASSAVCSTTEAQNVSVPHFAVPTQADQAPRYTGPGSCASATCHGSVTPRTDNRVLQNEYSTWIVKDKHSKAYASLKGDTGERMAAILGVGKAETAPKCLACHALDVPSAQRARTFDLSEGVSCENCHGPAAAWLGPHTERDWTHQKSLAAGMYDTRDLTKRSEKCLSCHLGNDEKSVDHEMIAAGHPDLYFELDSFSAVMPRHWKEASEPGGAANTDPWSDVRELTTGQAVQLKQSLLRLVSRTRGKHWPEYSELQCYACHHSLTPPEDSWRQARGYAGRRPGDPPWNPSRYTIFHELVLQADVDSAAKLDSELSRLSQLMSQLSPDRDAVAASANSSAKLVSDLSSKIGSMPADSASTLRLLQKISGDAAEISSQGEHAAAQAAMAIQSLFVAYERNEKLPHSAEIRTAITALFQDLQYPSAYDPARFAARMRQVNALLRE